ncbi:DUF1439 domain-containing protein [Photobacterium carnosum]|uniref:DUF1439 domain-containing protein n=1 Tax=Photobacterium carnosum TaxID=2023717 RepID=UPI001E42E75C|nr:DUF1439 domain-containing protein [Photobacterium carnosum]MCD9541794.1 DUF1439 domain-containing protein [Photobacterium carnosum]
MHLKSLLLAGSVVFFSGCASYSVTENEMQSYLNKETQFNHSVGIQGLAYATGKFDNIKVGIGRVAKNKVNVAATATADLELMGQPTQNISIKANFSAIPYYNQDQGAIYLKNLNIESLDITPQRLNNVLTKPVITPIVSFLSQVLSTKPVYKLNDNEIEQALLKKTKPELIIENHKLILDW